MISKNPSIVVLMTHSNIIQTHLNALDAWSFIIVEALDDCISDSSDPILLHFKECELELI